MDSCEPKSNRERKHGRKNGVTSSDPISARQRPDSPPASPTKITDLDDICLEKIFDHLGFHGLFNIAVANEWLRPAARFVYKRKFGKQFILINHIGSLFGLQAQKSVLILK